jgi:hypothetical protein
MDIDSIWAPVIAGLGSLTLAMAGPFVTAHFERRGRRDERREINQRATLHAVQDNMYEYIVAAATQAGLKWDDETIDIPAGTAARVRERSASLIRYIERVRDDRARDQLFAFHNAVGKLLDAPDPPAKVEAFTKVKTAYHEAQSAVGTALRKL